MIRSVILLSILPCVATIEAGTWIRSNPVGVPWPEARVTILSDSDRAGTPWTLTGSDGSIVGRGVLPAKAIGISSHNPKPYGAVLPVALPAPGTWKLAVGTNDTVSLVRNNTPWSFLAPLLVRHLRLMRSGPDQSLFRVASHLGDSSCPVMIPDGAWSNGKWKTSPSGRKLFAVGGWYDAGDQIKFTLTTAYTTYYLLRAWEANPGIHGRTLSSSTLPDLLEEARHGLDYLDRMLVDDTTFIIQVGDGLDHEQGKRLPQFDALDGKRPALVASSPMQMGYTAAALALGSRLFASLDPQRAARWKATALRLHGLCILPTSSREGAFLRQEVNDFYSDPTPWDNLALMERELHALTGDSLHLRLARTFADSAGTSWDPGWTEVGLTVDADLAADWAPSRERLATSFRTFRKYATTSAPLWGIPAQPEWGPLLGWPVLAADAWRSAAALSDTSLRAFSRDLIDYTLGRNNWGVSFVMSRRIPRAVRNIYGPIYQLTGEFPEGAVAEGPGSRSTHEELSQWFSIPQSAPETQFNTTSTVFFDNASDFQTMETTISQQAAMLYFVSVLSRAVGDTTQPTLPPILPDSLETWLASLQRHRVPLSANRWSVYDDQEEGGISTVELASTTDTSATAVFDIAVGTQLEYGYAGLVQELSSAGRALPWAKAIGVRMVVDIPSGRSARLQIRTSDVTDYDYFGATFPGKGNGTEAIVLFRDLAQQGFGKALTAFNPAKVSALEWVVSAPCDSSPLAVRSVELLVEPVIGIGTRATMSLHPLTVQGRVVSWDLPGTSNFSLELVTADGRRTSIPAGSARTGSLHLPATARLTWAVLRSQGQIWTRSIPPGH